ncbi:OsmC family protein [Dyadobacter arcticus]|uniref:OsmC-like protein n=1 Tax=Dyadobacter arcticus TaxID=1078754 RepID=A0ABX0UPV1_9BACT|nr:OsmC family protein [Dyadobacter arcticus]NIJ53046.1 putative OsmC-like protein [Dyadobacter arcticus]
MKISAIVKSEFNQHQIKVETDGSSKQVDIAPKPEGYGSSVNGGEMLLLALATCFCNDIYREAAQRNIKVSGVEVICTADFGAAGEAGNNFRYKANVISDASASEIEELIMHTDQIAEIHNTLRKGVQVTWAGQL